MSQSNLSVHKRVKNVKSILNNNITFLMGYLFLSLNEFSSSPQVFTYYRPVS